MLTAIATLDRLLDARSAVIGRDITTYRNHTYRVINLCVAQSPNALAQLEKIAIVGAGSLGDDSGAPQDHTVSRPSGVAG